MIKLVKDSAITIRISSEAKAIIQETAQRKGQTVSSFLAKLALKEAGATEQQIINQQAKAN